MHTSDIEICQREAQASASDLGLNNNLLERIYAARGIDDAQQLDYQFSQLPKPELMKGLITAASDLAQAIINNQSLLIVADFDADGATSCVLLMKGLVALGANNVSYLVPDRFKFGYGLTPEIVDEAHKHSPDIIITVDNGISSIAGVERANALGMKVLVTDHHLPGEQLPSAWHIINPNQPGCEFPYKSLAGVGVAFYLLLALRAELRQLGVVTEQTMPNLTEYLDLVALGTVADIVPLEHCNRLLVHHGLARIRAGRCRPAISAMLAIANRDQQNVVASDLGFAVGPRLNAAGRIDDMALGIEALLADEPGTAHRLCLQLDELNRQRRSIEADMQTQALDALESVLTAVDISVNEQQFGLSLFNESWHQGVVGLLASRIKDKVYRPVVAFAPSEPGSSELKGSARSIPGIHIRDLLADIAAEQPELLSKFGGHAMAAGLSLAAEQLDDFTQAFNDAVKARCDETILKNQVTTDGTLEDKDLSLENALLLERAGPFGQGFEEPMFHGEFIVLNQRIVGEQHLKFQLSTDTGLVLDAIAFFVDANLLETNLQRCQFTYKLAVNRFRDRQSLQLIINHILPLSS